MTSCFKPFLALLGVTALIILLAMASTAYGQQPPNVQYPSGVQVIPQPPQQAMIPVAPFPRLFRWGHTPQVSIAGDPRIYRARWGFFGRRIIVRRR